jgi:hypothetical protein
MNFCRLLYNVNVAVGWSKPPRLYNTLQKALQMQKRPKGEKADFLFGKQQKNLVIVIIFRISCNAMGWVLFSLSSWRPDIPISYTTHTIFVNSGCLFHPFSLLKCWFSRSLPLILLLLGQRLRIGYGVQDRQIWNLPSQRFFQHKVTIDAVALFSWPPILVVPGMPI